MITLKYVWNAFSFPTVVPNLWNVDGEVTVTEQKPGEVAEELASAYERKLIEVRLREAAPSLRMGCPGDFPETGPAC